MKNIIKIFLGIFILSLTAVFFILVVFYSKQNINDNYSLQPQYHGLVRGTDNKENTLNKLSLEQKIGQIFIIGFDGKYFNSEIENLIKNLHPGGILLLDRNIENTEQLKRLINSLQETAIEDSGLPLFIAVDQEGGLISRINWADRTPQSEIKNQEQALLIGKKRGEELKELGINLNLAPLLDQSFPGDFIFERTFKKDIETIGESAAALIKGQKESGILSAIKHFPGYGNISFNPEEKLAILSEMPETSQFQSAVSAMPEMIMVSNVVYKDIDLNLPFSFSEKAIKLLKEELKKDYLLISDDLSQNSLLNKFSLEDIVSLPFKSGVDILIFSGWRMLPEKGTEAFKEVFNSGEISKERIDEAVLKIIKLKEKI